MYDARVARLRLTPDGEHLQPTTSLPDANETDDTDYSKRQDAKLLGKLVHAELQRCPLLVDLLHGRSAP